MGLVIKRFDVFLVALNPTVGTEIRKTRPCLIISPDEINDYLSTVIIAPMTRTRKSYPVRVNCIFENKPGAIALDQMRAIDKKRCRKNLGTIDPNTRSAVLTTLAELFAA
ncbi:MAG: type II toxin-antitoxin system PemK/MazF family toxin [Cyanobacteria bacterium J06614_10]